MFEHIRSVLNDPTTVLDPYQYISAIYCFVLHILNLKIGPSWME